MTRTCLPARPPFRSNGCLLRGDAVCSFRWAGCPGPGRRGQSCQTTRRAAPFDRHLEACERLRELLERVERRGGHAPASPDQRVAKAGRHPRFNGFAGRRQEVLEKRGKSGNRKAGALAASPPLEALRHAHRSVRAQPKGGDVARPFRSAGRAGNRLDECEGLGPARLRASPHRSVTETPASCMPTTTAKLRPTRRRTHER